MSITNQQNTVDAIYDAIKASVGSLMGNRIYELIAPQDTELPCCVYQIITDNVESALSECGDKQEVILQVRFSGWQREGSKALRTISDTLFDDLHRGQITIDDATVSDTVDGQVKGVITVAENVLDIRQEYLIQII